MKEERNKTMKNKTSGKIEIIKGYIGEKLFEQLSYGDKVFMSETAGSIDFGCLIDLNKIAKAIKDYKE